MRLAICDADEFSVAKTKEYIFDFFERRHLKCPEISVFTDGESLLENFCEIDILFLAIELPGINGIHVGNALKQKNSSIIIFVITSYFEYLDDAMRFGVFRYLPKPPDKERFLQNLGDALKLYNTSYGKIAIETPDSVFAAYLKDIIYVETMGRKTIIHTAEKDYESVYNIQYWTRQLPAKHFYRTHRSYLINLEHVTNFNHESVNLFHDQFQAYLTRRKYTRFKETYFLYLESTR